MSDRITTTEFQDFVDTTIFDRNFMEIYDLYQVAAGNDEAQSTYTREAAPNGNIIISHEPTNAHLILTPKAAEFFPDWIIENLMEGFDAESFYGMRHAEARDAEHDRD